MNECSICNENIKEFAILDCCIHVFCKNCIKTTKEPI